MIVVTIHLVSSRRNQEIGRMYIANEGGTETSGDYVAAVARKGTTRLPRELFDDQGPGALGPKATRVSHVKGHARKALSVWHLVTRALKAAYPEAK